MPFAWHHPAGNTGKWQDLRFTAAEQRDFIKMDLGPALQGSGGKHTPIPPLPQGQAFHLGLAHTPPVKLIILDDQRSHLPAWAHTVTADARAAQFVDGIGVHWYTAVEDVRRTITPFSPIPTCGMA